MERRLWGTNPTFRIFPGYDTIYRQERYLKTAASAMPHQRRSGGLVGRPGGWLPLPWGKAASFPSPLSARVLKVLDLPFPGTRRRPGGDTATANTSCFSTHSSV
ncbi:Hypothetical protein RMHFA_04224 [Roseomonas mucosa]|nr:Hypothetical protein RMHFA_04224 [Roseomonas mucosa]